MHGPVGFDQKISEHAAEIFSKDKSLPASGALREIAVQRELLSKKRVQNATLRDRVRRRGNALREEWWCAELSRNRPST